MLGHNELLKLWEPVDVSSVWWSLEKQFSPALPMGTNHLQMLEWTEKSVCKLWTRRNILYILPERQPRCVQVECVPFLASKNMSLCIFLIAILAYELSVIWMAFYDCAVQMYQDILPELQTLGWWAISPSHSYVSSFSCIKIMCTMSKVGLFV